MNLLIEEETSGDDDSIMIADTTWKEIKVGIAVGDFDASNFIDKLDKIDLEMYQKLNSKEDLEEEKRFRVCA